ncbi:MAG: hypothetical protein HY762_08795 [Planctomycetes bacterium]|nr:hypothetical protein [Planctomycetota bacterium]
MGGKASDIEWVTAFSLDIDPRRDKNTPSTDEEHQLAIKMATQLSYDYENSVVISSGNGTYLWLPCHPFRLSGKHKELEEKTKEWEARMRERVEEETRLTLDFMWDIARIKKVPGTLSIKGQLTPDRPHRVAKFITEALDKPTGILEEILSMKISGIVTSNIDITATNGELPYRFLMLLKHNSKITDTWEGKRIFGQKNSRSEFDMSLASQLVAMGFTDQEIATIMIKSPSGKGGDATNQYIEHTIAKARMNHPRININKSACSEKCDALRVLNEIRRLVSNK